MKKQTKTILFAGLGLAALSGVYYIIKETKEEDLDINDDGSETPQLNLVREIIAPTLQGTIRPSDPFGSGAFGAKRGGRKHKGIDYLAYEGEGILSPIYGKVSRYAYPYADDLSYQGIEIIGLDEHEGYRIKMFYFVPFIPIGDIIEPGTIIGKAQDIAKRYGFTMNNHVHLEMYKDNELIDPSTVIKTV